MTDLIRFSCLQVGPHTGANDFSDIVTNPSRFLRPDARPWLGGAWYERLARDWQTCDGEKIADIQGAQLLDTLPDMAFAFRGLSAGGAPDAVNVSGLDLELDDILTHVFGQAAVNGLGDDLAVGGTSTAVRSTGAPSALNVGSAIMVPLATSGKNQARFCLSEDGTDYTVERPFTDGFAGPDTPAAAGNIYASRTFALAPKGVNVAHLFADFESELTRFIYRGIAVGSLTLAFTNRGITLATIGGLQFNSFESQAPAAPTFAEPAHGSEIVHYDSPMWIGNNEVACKDTTVTITKTLSPRESPCGEQGRFGYAVDDYAVELSTMVRFGSLDGEADTALRDTLQGGSIQDIAFQSGRQPGAASYFRMAEADVNAQEVADGAHVALQVTAKSSGIVPCTLSIF